ncbi:MAG: hypothetical protein J1G04_02160 [Clostridiales bacterium]|nr:hypothetical protein [Clostridiales bacterium]
MDIKISKHKYIQFCLLALLTSLLIIVTGIIFIFAMASVDYVFNLRYTIVFISALAGDIIVPIIVFIILRAVNKSYYLIKQNGITLFKDDQEVFFIPASRIRNLIYVKFRYAFILRMGAGRLHVPFTEARGNIKPTMIFPDSSMLLFIDMSGKQAEQVARILERDLQK